MLFNKTLENFELHMMISSYLNLITLREILNMSMTSIENVLDHDLHDDEDLFHNVLFQM